MPSPIAMASSAALHASQAPSLSAEVRRPQKSCEAEVGGKPDRSDKAELKVIRLPQLKALLGISRSTIYSRISAKSKYYDPLFPKSVSLGPKAVGWILKDVYFYIENLKTKAN